MNEQSEKTLPEVPVIQVSNSEIASGSSDTSSTTKLSPIDSTQPVHEANEDQVVVQDNSNADVQYPEAVLSWRESEYIEHSKSPMWFLGLAGISILLLLFAIFIIKEWSFAILIVVMSAAVGIWAKRPARVIEYSLDREGVLIDGRSFYFRDFRSFSITQESEFVYSIVMVPNKRLTPGVNIYFPEKLGEQIVDVFGAALPIENIEPDFIDNLAKKLRF